MAIDKLGMGSAWLYGLGKGCENVSKRQGRHSLGRNIQWTCQNGGQGERSMSIFSRYIKKQIAKRGLKALILRVVEIAVKLTPSKKDDKLLSKVKSTIDEFEE